MIVWNKRNPRTPVDAVYVGRPTKWGNPFSHLPSARAFHRPTREDAIIAFYVWVYEREQAWLREAARRELRGKDLVCWCPPKDCHAWVWVEIANA